MTHRRVLPSYKKPFKQQSNFIKNNQWASTLIKTFKLTYLELETLSVTKNDSNDTSCLAILKCQC